MLYVMPFILAMVMTLAWMPVLGRLAVRWSIVDQPGARKVHATPIPRIGGLAMLIGLLVTSLVVIPFDRRDAAFLGAAALLGCFGALDDRFNLDYRTKLAGQLIAVAIVVLLGGVRIEAMTFDERWMLPEGIALPLTFFFLIGITNAINLADGLDGLAGGTTLLCLCALALFAHSGGQYVCASLALALAGSVLGFLRFNTYPATVFMGDAGSQLLGFAVGVLSIRATQSGSSALSATVPIMLLAIPILDTLSVMVQRMSEGRSPFSADKNHLHHKLLALGFDHHEAVTVIYALQADLFLMAYWMRYESDLVILAAVSSFFAGVVLLLQLAARHHWRFRSRAAGEPVDSPLSRALTELRAPGNLPRWSYLGVAAGALGYALLVLLETVELSADVSLLILALLGVTITWLLMLRARPLSLVEKGAFYVTAAILVYLDTSVLPPSSTMAAINWSALGIAAVGIVVRLRMLKQRQFALTPLDLIVLFIALVVPSLIDGLGLPDRGAAGIAKLVILFYAVEVMVNRMDVGVLWLRIAVAGLLAALVVRPLLPV